MFEILRREEMANGTVVLNEISAPKIAAKAKPGQFVILKANETGERIPLTMADTDPKKGTLTIIYQVVGKSTALFKSLQVGERFQDVIGPLGQPTHLEKLGYGSVCRRRHRRCGDAPHHARPERSGQSCHRHHRSPHQGSAHHGRQDESRFHELHVCTDDGSYGHHGFVTEVLKKILETKDVKLVVGIGARSHE